MLLPLAAGSRTFAEGGTKSYQIGESETAARVHAEAQACASRATAALKEACFRELYNGLLQGRPESGTSPAWEGSQPAFARAVRSLPPPMRAFIFSSCRIGSTYEAREAGYTKLNGRTLNDPQIVSTCWRDRADELERKMGDVYRIIGEFAERGDGAGAQRYFERLRGSGVASHRLIHEFLSRNCDGAQDEYECHADTLETMMHNLDRGKGAIGNAAAYTARFGIVEDECRRAMGLGSGELCSRQFGLWNGTGDSLYSMQFGPNLSVLRGDYAGNDIPYEHSSPHAGSQDGTSSAPATGTGAGGGSTDAGGTGATGTEGRPGGTGASPTAGGKPGGSATGKGGSRVGPPGGKAGGHGISTEAEGSSGSSHREGEDAADPFTACSWDEPSISPAGFCGGETSPLRELLGVQAATSMRHFNAHNYLELLRMEAISQTVMAHHTLVGRRMTAAQTRAEVTRLLRERGCEGLSSGIANELSLPEPVAPRIRTDEAYRVEVWQAARRVQEVARGARVIARIARQGYYSRIGAGYVANCPYFAEMRTCEQQRALGARGGEIGVCSASGGASYRASIEQEYGFVSDNPQEIVRRLRGGGRGMVCSTRHVLEEAQRIAGAQIASELRKYPYLAAGHSPTDDIHENLAVAFEFADSATSAAQIRGNPGILDGVVERATTQLASDLSAELESYCDGDSGRSKHRWRSLLSTPLLKEQLYDDLRLTGSQREQMARMHSCMLEKLDTGGPLKMFAMAACIAGSLVPGANAIVIPACAAGFAGEAYLEMSIAEDEARDRHRCAFASHVCSEQNWIEARDRYNDAVDGFWTTVISEGIGLPGYLKMLRHARAARLARLQDAGSALESGQLDDFARRMEQKTRQLELAGQMPPGPQRDAAIARLSDEVDTLIDDAVDAAQRNADEANPALGRTAPADDPALGRTAPAPGGASDDLARGGTAPARPGAGAAERPAPRPERAGGGATPAADPPEMPRGIPNDYNPTAYSRTYDRPAASLEVRPASPPSGNPDDLIDLGTRTIEFPEIHYRPRGAGQSDLDLLQEAGVLPHSYGGNLQEIAQGGFRRTYTHPADPDKVVKVFDPNKIRGFPTEAHIEHYRRLYPNADTPTIVDNLKRQLTAAMVQRDLAIYRYLVGVEEAYTAAGKAPPFRIARITSTPEQLERGIVVQERVGGTAMWDYWDDSLPRAPPAASRYFGEMRRHQEAIQAAVSSGCDRLRIFACHGLTEIEELGIDWGGRYNNVVVRPEGNGQDVAVMYDW